MRITIVTHFEVPGQNEVATCWSHPRPGLSHLYNFSRRRDLVTCMRCTAKLAKQDEQALLARPVLA